MLFRIVSIVSLALGLSFIIWFAFDHNIRFFYAAAFFGFFGVLTMILSFMSRRGVAVWQKKGQS